MPAAQVPGPVRTLAAVTRALIGHLRTLVADEMQFKALQAELGLPPRSYDEDAVREVNDRLVEVDGKLASGAERSEDDFSFDPEIIELLLKGKAFVQVVETLFAGDRYQGDARTAADVSVELLGILATEWLRVHKTWAWVILRFVMFGYERIEELPRLDPLVIFDRLSGQAPKTSDQPFGAMELVGGIAIPALIIAINQLIDRWSEPQPEAQAKLPDGAKYYVSDIDFKLGWEPDPDTDAAVLELMARSITLLVKGKQKTRNSAAEADISFDFSAVHFDDPAADPADGQGFAIRIGGSGGETFDLAPQGDIARKLSFAMGGGPGLDLLWTGKGLRSEGPGQGPFVVEAKYLATGTEDVPAFRYGKAGKSRLDIVGFDVAGNISQDDQSIGLGVRGGRLSLHLDEIVPGLGSLFSALGADKFEAKLDGRLKASSRAGLCFEGEAGLKIRVASGLKIPGAARLDYLDLELGSKDKALRLGAMAAGRFSVGAFTASIDAFGVAYAPTTGEASFLPPKGIGLRVDAGLVKGGGYLMLDFEAQQFAGTMELTIGAFSVKAIAILSTGGPGSDARFALFVLIYMRWPGGIELALRFTLNAIGGMLGVNHDFDEQALMRAMPSGAMDDVLFPDDPVGDAPRIIASLKTIFPVRRGADVIGIMAEIGWGSDHFCSLRLGLILPFGRNAGPDNGFEYLYIVGRLQIVCFKDIPKPIRLEITCDLLGRFGVGANGIDIGLYARLRDSRIGPTAIEGGLAFAVRTGPDPRFLIAAGGFHPAFKEIPADFPSPIDRIGASYDIGVMKVWLRGYTAVTSGSVQFGVELGCRYKLGPIGFTAELGFDALIHFSPFEFEARARAGAALSYRGHELLGIHLELTIWGPDRWRIKGHGSFTIFVWDVDVNVDESWGDDVATPEERIRLHVKVQEDLLNRTNWSFALPSGGDPLVTVSHAGLPADPAVQVVHPLSGMSYVQRRIPFGLALDRVSFCAIDGPKVFPVPAISFAGGEPAPGTTLFEPFAVPEYLTLTDEQKLSRPGFEQLPAGVSVGAGGYVVPDRAEEVAIECELIFSRREPSFKEFGLATIELVGLKRMAGHEAAGRSAMRPFQPRLADRAPVRTSPPLWAAAEPATLAGATTAPDWARHSAAAVAAATAPGLEILEACELAGAA